MPPRWGFWFQWNERHRRVGPTHVCIPARRRRKTGDKDDDDAINDMQLRMAGGFGLLSGQGNLTLGSLTQRNATASNSRRHKSKCKRVQVCQSVLDQADNESFWPRVVSYFRNITRFFFLALPRAVLFHDNIWLVMLCRRGQTLILPGIYHRKESWESMPVTMHHHHLQLRWTKHQNRQKAAGGSAGEATLTVHPSPGRWMVPLTKWEAEEWNKGWLDDKTLNGFE